MSTTRERSSQIKTALADGDARALLMSPKTLLESADSLRLLQGNKSSRFPTNDESHLLHSWTDFPDAFQCLGVLTPHLGITPILLLLSRTFQRQSAESSERVAKVDPRV